MGERKGRPLVHGTTRSYAFECARSHHGYSGLVERASVLSSVVRRRRGAPSPPVAELVHRLVLAYRASLNARAAAGEFDWIRCRRLGNCRPAFAVVKPRSKFCKQPHICPSCWARRAVAIWQRIDRSLFPQREDGTRPRRCAYSLIRARRTFGSGDLTVYKGGNLGAAVADRASSRKFGPSRVIPGRGYELKKLAPAGALDVFTLDFHYPPPSGWKASIRQVFVVAAGQDLVIPGAVFKRIESPTRKQVAKAVAWAWRYPRGLLLRDRKPADPRMVATYLAACKGRRMWATYGVFNAGQPWDKGLHEAARKRAAEKRAARQAEV